MTISTVPLEISGSYKYSGMLYQSLLSACKTLNYARLWLASCNTLDHRSRHRYFKPDIKLRFTVLTYHLLSPALSCFYHFFSGNFLPCLAQQREPALNVREGVRQYMNIDIYKLP